MGESDLHTWQNIDKAILPWVSSINLACGVHGGDPKVMEETLLEAKRLGIAVGAHPGPWDRENKGRGGEKPSPEEIPALIRYQIGALKSIADPIGIPIQHVKPHGTLYHEVHNNYAAARAFVNTIKEFDPSLIIIGQAPSYLKDETEQSGLLFAKEGFVDRAYQGNGKLVPRDQDGALLENSSKIIMQALEIVMDNYVTTINGNKIPIEVETICIHSDTPNAPKLAQLVWEALRNKGYTLISLKDAVCRK